MSATATATAAPTVNPTAGETAIINAAKPGANVKTLLKAVWSTRGFLRVNVGGATAYGGLGIIKADLTAGILKALPEDYAAPYLLEPTAGGAYLTPVENWVAP